MAVFNILVLYSEGPLFESLVQPAIQRRLQAGGMVFDQEGCITRNLSPNKLRVSSNIIVTI
jgi:hypothetical protein